MSVKNSSKTKDYIEKRIIEEARYIIDTKATIRRVAKIFGVSKSCVHRDLTVVLPKLNPGMAEQTHNIIQFNKEQRHVRGGEATKNKFKYGG